MGEYRFIPDRSVDSYRKSDTGFIISVILMWGIGIFTLFVCSSSYAAATLDDSLYFVKRQLIASLVGFIGLLFFAVCPLGKQRKLLPVIVLITFVLCLLTFIPGIQYERNGAHRWIKMPFFTFQPSELVKFVIVIYLANYFDKYCRKSDDDEDKTVSPAVVSLVIFVTVIFMQKDFSTGIFVLFIGLLIFFIAKAKMLWFVPFCILGIPAVILMVLTEEYRVNRIAAFLNPDEFVQSYNFQSIASKRAVSSGGFWGQGIGEGLERLNNIPEVQSDYIFAGWAEAMGFVGVLLYFLLLMVFVIKAVKIAIRCPDRFSSFGTMGCVAVIFFQSLMNVGVVCGVLPTTGIPLPFFSSGGSSIIVTLCMCGFIINASKCDSDTLEEETDISRGLGGNFESLDINIFK
ncbi:MAG: cell division protein FtsW [Treponema sp.]|uniref:FtsW/RodA/SpoVE family cell cycle protein n=1 Tax=Treponema sp. TaxID=166 RepID=UPI001B458272|nr:putative peptidoglycan glycosyltransferase FtsW [Treponema sp.]MBP5402395.1 cell division protein FtsW [Treponema sp.]MBR5934160.1 cell division protein FtsW [Treponema sp.]